MNDAVVVCMNRAHTVILRSHVLGTLLRSRQCLFVSTTHSIECTGRTWLSLFIGKETTTPSNSMVSRIPLDGCIDNHCNVVLVFSWHFGIAQNVECVALVIGYVYQSSTL